jgi:hypothetical protein
MHSIPQNNKCKKFKQLTSLFYHERVIFAYSHNLVRVCMECDYTCWDHNLLMSQKKVVSKGMIIKGFTIYGQVQLS